MDRNGVYTLYFSFPFNKETSSLYSEDDELNIENINRTLDSIDLVISSHGFISMEMIMKFFGLRPTRHCPGIYFTELGESEIVYDEINHTDVVKIYLSNEMKLRPVIRRRMTEEDIMEEIRIRDNDNKPSRFFDRSEEQKEEKPECQTGQKEASGSEEKEET